jgi:hypothetical protein
MKIQLIPEIKQAYKLLSVQLATVVTVLAGLQVYLPEMVTFLPPTWVPFATGAILVARVIKFSIDTIGEQHVGAT